MSDPSAFLCGAAAVYALAPRSTVPKIFAHWIGKLASDDLWRDFADTSGKFAAYLLFVALVSIIEKILP